MNRRGLFGGLFGLGGLAALPAMARSSDHIIKYADPSTWPAYIPWKTSDGSISDKALRAYWLPAVWGFAVDCGLPADLSVNKRGAAITIGPLSFLAVSREAIDRMGSYSTVFFCQHANMLLATFDPWPMAVLSPALADDNRFRYLSDGD